MYSYIDHIFDLAGYQMGTSGVNGFVYKLNIIILKCDDRTFPLALYLCTTSYEWTLVLKKRSTLAIAGYASYSD